MVALSHFISHLSEKGLAFFKLLKAQEKFVWSEDANKAFVMLKRFLTSPRIMTAPQASETHLVYIAMTNRVVITTIVVIGGS
jgi:hypothetical protein